MCFVQVRPAPGGAGRSRAHRRSGCCRELLSIPIQARAIDAAFDLAHQVLVGGATDILKRSWNALASRCSGRSRAGGIRSVSVIPSASSP